MNIEIWGIQSDLIWGFMACLGFWWVLLIYCLPDVIFKGMKKLKQWERDETIKRAQEIAYHKAEEENRK